jgi:hypothetical protein
VTPGATISSMRSSTSSERTTSAAVSWDGRVAQDERDGHLNEGEPGVLGQFRQLLGGVEFAVVLRLRHVEPGAGPGRRHRAAAGIVAVAAGEPAAGERAVRDDAHPAALRQRQDLVLDVAGEHRVGGLLGDEPFAAALPGDVLSVEKRRGREGRVAEVADLARSDEVGERAEGLVEVDRRVVAVHLIEVDVIGP